MKPPVKLEKPQHRYYVRTASGTQRMTVARWRSGARRYLGLEIADWPVVLVTEETWRRVLIEGEALVSREEAPNE